MNRPLPPLHATPEERKQLLSAAHDAQQHQRLQARSLLQTQQARTRRQVAHRLGVNRDPVGRWRDAYALGGLARMAAIATAPGTPARLAAAMQPGLRARLAQPQGCARDNAVWPW
jgi:hypothetical protein